MSTFSKSERLCSRNLIDPLFASGNRLLVFPFSVRWTYCPDETFAAPAQIMLVTPKRKLHHAVDRNRTRRMMRECYRANKPALYGWLTAHNRKIILAVSYIHTPRLDFPSLLSSWQVRQSCRAR